MGAGMVRYQRELMKPHVILLVNADPSVEKAATEAVMETRHGLRIARTSADALRILSEDISDVDAIILDLDPQVHGVALLAAISGFCADIKVIAVTGLEEQYMRPLALNRGAAVCLGKPVTAQAFIDAILYQSKTKDRADPVIQH